MSTPYPLPNLNSGPRAFVTSDLDHGGIALTVGTLLAVYAVLCFISRMYMRLTVSGPVGWDDIICGVATFFGSLEMVVFGVAIHFGLGKKMEILDQTAIPYISKVIYAAQLIYITTNALTKCSVALLLARLILLRSRLIVCYGLVAVSALWGLASFLVIAIKCTDRPPWVLVGPGKCVNTTLTWQVITAVNVAIELGLLAIPVWLVWSLQTNFSRKLTVVAVFGLRVLVIPAALVRLHYLQTVLPNSRDPFFDGVAPFICLNLELHYGLMASTMPTLKAFVNACNTGFGTHDSAGVSGYGSSNSYAMQSLESGGKSSNGQPGGPGGAKRRSTKLPFSPDRTQDSFRTADSRRRSRHVVDGNYVVDEALPKFGKTTTMVRAMPSEERRERRRSVRSDSSCRQMVIQQTTTCEVRYEEEEAKREVLESRGRGGAEADSMELAPVNRRGSG